MTLPNFVRAEIFLAVCSDYNLFAITIFLFYYFGYKIFCILWVVFFKF